MSLHPPAGKAALYDLLVNVPHLISAYYTGEPAPTDPAQGVAFGTSGYRGSPFKR
jgi:phosphoglucomutase